MPRTLDAPADTSMMRIVHDALRRDLGRARRTLALDPPPDRRQRAAIDDHLRWMLDFLEAHHRSEDVGLYPLVRERDPSAASLLDDMDRDHHSIAEAVVGLRGALDADADADAATVVAGIDHLSETLLPHLAREEHETMPVVSRAITDAEWRAIEQEHNLEGKTAAQLGAEGHWLIDGAAAEDRSRVLGLVPWLPRQLLIYGMGPAYRRRSRARWNPARRGIQHQGSVAVVVDAEVDDVWAVVRDPTRVGEWSHECVGATWIGAVTEARPGARFRGRNRQGLIRWGRRCEIVRADGYELVWRTVPTRLYPDSTEWALRVSRQPGGTRIEQTFRVVKGTALEPLYAALLPAHRDRIDQLRGDLERIGSVAARPGVLGDRVGRDAPAGASAD